jgi:hypothetical protein
MYVLTVNRCQKLPSKSSSRAFGVSFADKPKAKIDEMNTSLGLI